MTRLLRVLVCIVLIIFCRPVSAQEIQPSAGSPAGDPLTRTVQGRVLDVKGDPVPNAVVLIKDLKTLQVRSYIADKTGSYRFYGLSSEVNFELRAQANGLSSKRKTVSVFDSHRVVKLDLKLKKKKKERRTKQ